MSEALPFELLERRGPYLAIAKPAGLLSHGRESVLAEFRRLFGADWHHVHRLDRETSGVLLFAEGKEALRAASESWREKVRKNYAAIAWIPANIPPMPGAGRIEEPILEFHSSRPNLLTRALRAAYGEPLAGRLLQGGVQEGIPPLPPPARSSIHPAGRPAVTDWELMLRRPPLAFVRLSPRQGRMHQLRLHVRALGGEIAGDRLYGERPDRRWNELPGVPFDRAEPLVSRLALHLQSLEWIDPPGSAGENWKWSAPVPPEWSELCAWMRLSSDTI